MAQRVNGWGSAVTETHAINGEAGALTWGAGVARQAYWPAEDYGEVHRG